jgi:hypothetical protein
MYIVKVLMKSQARRTDLEKKQLVPGYIAHDRSNPGTMLFSSWIGGPHASLPLGQCFFMSRVDLKNPPNGYI